MGLARPEPPRRLTVPAPTTSGKRRHAHRSMHDCCLRHRPVPGDGRRGPGMTSPSDRAHTEEPGKNPEGQPAQEPGAGQDRRWLTAGVGSVGAASFFSDTGHEIATSVLPTFLTGTLHAGPAALGAIEGVSDALTGLAKLAGGPLAADTRRRARLASGGYLGTALATAAIGLAATVWQVAVLRAVAWVSRGIRSPARDSLLATLAPPRAYGRAFGVERAGDNAGAVAGPLLAALLVSTIGVRHAIWFALVPGVLAALAITVAARQARTTLSSPDGRKALTLNLRELHGAGLPRILAPVALFELGNLATTLLILRATDLLHTDGRDATAAASLAILLYALHNAAATAASLGGGHVIDLAGPRAVSLRPPSATSPRTGCSPSAGTASQSRCSASCSPVSASAWARRRSQPPSPASSPTASAPTGSACSAWSSHSATSAPPWSPACSGRPSPPPPPSLTPPPGCSCLRAPPCSSPGDPPT